MDISIGVRRAIRMAIASSLPDTIAHAWNARAATAIASPSTSRAITMRRLHRALEIRVGVTTPPCLRWTSARVALRVLLAGCG